MPANRKQGGNKGSGPAAYMKYAGLAFQLFFTFAIVFYIGKKIDAHFENEKLYITVILIVITFVAMMYRIMKDLEK